MNKPSSRVPFARRLLERLFPDANSHEPETREQLVELLRTARKRALFDIEALSMMEGCARRRWDDGFSTPSSRRCCGTRTGSSSEPPRADRIDGQDLPVSGTRS